MVRYLSLSVLLITHTFVAAQAVPPPDEMGDAWAKQWTKTNEDFSDSRDKAKEAALKKLDKAIDHVNRLPGLTPAARTDRREELQAARKAFDKTGTFPKDDDFAGIELEYFLKINKAAVTVSRMIDEVIDKGSKTENGALEKQGLKMKAELDEQLGGASRLVRNSVWEGQLRRPSGNTIPYRLEIGKMGNGGLFKGHVEDNPGVAGNWSYDIEGQTRALGVQYKMSKSLRGNFTAVAVEGIVSGDRLIAEIVSVAGKGKPATSLIVLKRVR
jgi:hypothetical protein